MKNKKNIAIKDILLYGIKKNGLYLAREEHYVNYTSFIKEARMFVVKETAEQLAKDINGIIVMIQIKEKENVS